jgi:cytochrome c oxidase subunit 3
MINRKQFQFFPFHLVDMSPWPILTSFSAFVMAISAVMCFHGFENGGKLLLLGFILTATVMTLWFKDVVTEGRVKNFNFISSLNSIVRSYVLSLYSSINSFIFSTFNSLSINLSCSIIRTVAG